MTNPEASIADGQCALVASKPALGIEDLPVAVVGLRVPLGGGTSAVFVTIEVDHFDATSVEQLASEVVIDYTRAKECD